MPRPKKGDPELLLVSFCDIVTITTAALFMAMVVVIDQASKTPIYRPTPIATATTNEPIYFECRANQVFHIDKTNLASILHAAMTNTVVQTGEKTGSGLGGMERLMQQDIGDRFYKVDPGYLLIGEVALIPRTNTIGIPVAEFTERTNAFTRQLIRIKPASQYLVFLVRDDSFPVFRKARELTVNSGYISGWEFLDRTEPITFAGTFAHVKTQ